MKINTVALTPEQQQTVQEEFGDHMIHWACTRRNEVRDELHDKILFLESREGYTEKQIAYDIKEECERARSYLYGVYEAIYGMGYINHEDLNDLIVNVYRIFNPEIQRIEAHNCIKRKVKNYGWQANY